MKRVSFLLFTLILALSSGPSSAATIELFEWALNDGGTVYFIGDALPTHIDMSGFDETTGLGQIVVTYPRGMAGNHSIVAFFDHDIDFALNDNINETGAVVGTPAAGQSWEIDEPGYDTGDIVDNVLGNALDNAIGTSVFNNTTFPNEVSMAMAWNFTTMGNQSATVVFNLGETAPTAPFYLEQNDPDSVQPASVYFDSSLAVVTAQVSVVPNILLPLLLSD